MRVFSTYTIELLPILLYSNFVIRGMLIGVISGLVCTGCGQPPGAFLMPGQRSLNLGQDPGGLGPWIVMDDPASDDYIVRDISPGRDHHRDRFGVPERRQPRLDPLRSCRRLSHGEACPVGGADSRERGPRDV
jgi:hypothetical protein